MTVYVVAGDGVRHNIMNLSYNGARDVGSAVGGGGGAMNSKKQYTWSSAIPSAIDEDDDVAGMDGAARDTKRMRAAMDSVA